MYDLLLRQQYVIYTDHKPLTFLTSFKELVECRYQWIAFLEEMHCVIRYIPGKDNIISDFISRNGINEEPLQILSVILDSVTFSSDELSAEQRNNPQIAAVLTYLTLRKEMQRTAALSQDYRQCLHKLCIINRLLTYNHHGNLCVVAPRSLKNKILVMSHTEWSAGHFGLYKTHQKILNNFWWPNMFRDTKEYLFTN